MKNLITVLMILFATTAFGQDYVMFETHYLTPKAGHEAALNEEVAEHNRLFHAEGPYANTVTSIVNGPHTGDLSFAMGPCTFTQLDDRPSSPEHAADWASVMLHAEKITNVEYWRQNDDLSVAPETESDTPPSMLRVRFFDVSDNALFVKVQGQIVATIKAMGVTRARTMYQREFAHSDSRDWAYVSPYNSWSELDEEGDGNFRETFIATHGEGSWETFVEEIGQAIEGREDQWGVIQTSLMGSGDN